MSAPTPCVLHVAAAADADALEVVARTAEVFAAQRVGQVVLALDEGRDEQWTLSPQVGTLRRLRCAGLSIVRRVRALQAEFLRLSEDRILCAVHLHGAGPCFLGAQALRGSALRGRVLYTPRRRGGAWAAGLLDGVLQRQLSPFAYTLLAPSSEEAPLLSKAFKRSAEVLPLPVPEEYFAAARRDPGVPEVLAEGGAESTIEAVETASRLCVLLNGREQRVRFSWLGSVEGALRAKLEAAGARVLDAIDDLGRADALASATAFIYVCSSGRHPLPVAQAMAAGVPCLASDTPSHRALIDHGETGLICASAGDYIEQLVFLLRERAARAALGEAARERARRRFTPRQFHAAVLRAYGLRGWPGVQRGSLLLQVPHVPQAMPERIQP